MDQVRPQMREQRFADCASLDWPTGPHPTLSGSGPAPTADRSKTSAVRLGVMHTRTRMAVALWSIATLVAVFPANVNMAVNADRFERGVPGGRVALWARLPVQAVFVAWAWAARRP